MNERTTKEEDCVNCKGTGWQRNYDAPLTNQAFKCTVCFGQGKVKSPCPHCGHAKSFHTTYDFPFMKYSRVICEANTNPRIICCGHYGGHNTRTCRCWGKGKLAHCSCNVCGEGFDNLWKLEEHLEKKKWCAERFELTFYPLPHWLEETDGGE